MRSYLSNWISLRKKITGLALVPALIISIVFGALIWTSSRSTARLVGQELTDFMTERTMRSTVHGYNTSIVTYGYVMQMLDANLATARLLLAKEGGIHQGGSTRVQAVNQETHATAMVTAPVLSIGGWQANGGGGGPLAAISSATGRATFLYARVSPAGDMMRVGGTTPDGSGHVEFGSYIPARSVSGEESPMAHSILAGAPFHGTSIEMGSWYSVVCDPLKEGSGNVYGMFCMGLGQQHHHVAEGRAGRQFCGCERFSSGLFCAWSEEGPDVDRADGASPRRRRISGCRRCLPCRRR